MAITDELRGWINDNYPAWRKLRTGVFDQLDRIDEAHERELTMARGEAANKVLEVMGDGYIALPKDANGEVIHLGDVVMLPDWPLNHHEVINLVYAHDGWAIISRHGSIEASEHTVHVKPKKPTVEDVLREMADRCYADEDEPRDRDAIIAEYAAKLQLKED